ncbi:unnamed protein product, partial [Brenthis ino]
MICPNMVRGIDHLRDPRLNKGLAFTLAERQALGIQGLLAADYKTQEEQLNICRISLDRYKDSLNKYLYLVELQDTNEKIFFSLLAQNIEKYLPIVYTPTVGLACQRFGLIYRRPRGLFVTIYDKGHVLNILNNWPEHDVRAIVFTDGERILGLGDLGAYGMGIPVGKLALYTALGGIKPHQCLPITLDVGTDNQDLLEDPLYIGLRQKRVRGKEYDDFIDEFMKAAIERFGPNTLLQAATGIANLIVAAMVEDGMKKEEAQNLIYMFDVEGLLSKRRKNGLPGHAKQFGKDIEPETNFEKCVATIKPTCLIGCSTVGGAFTETILKQMAINAERPVIFALSNPTSKAECTAQAAYDHTQGKCVFASGSPFPPVKYKDKEYRTGQGNNSYIFPGIALGVIVSRSRRITESMFLTAATTLANFVSEEDLALGRIYPPLSDVRNVSLNIAIEVAKLAYTKDFATAYPKPKDFKTYIQEHTYNLKYDSYIPKFFKYPKAPDIKVKTIEEVYKGVV